MIFITFERRDKTCSKIENTFSQQSLGLDWNLYFELHSFLSAFIDNLEDAFTYQLS